MVVITSHRGMLTGDRTIGDWLNTAGYEAAGRSAARQPAMALVPIDDVRQAVAWLCGRTQRAGTCALAHAAGAVAIADARPYGWGRRGSDMAPRGSKVAPSSGVGTLGVVRVFVLRVLVPVMTGWKRSSELDHDQWHQIRGPAAGIGSLGRWPTRTLTSLASQHPGLKTRRSGL